MWVWLTWIEGKLLDRHGSTSKTQTKYYFGQIFLKKWLFSWVTNDGQGAPVGKRHLEGNCLTPVSKRHLEGSYLAPIRKRHLKCCSLDITWGTWGSLWFHGGTPQSKRVSSPKWLWQLYNHHFKCLNSKLNR